MAQVYLGYVVDINEWEVSYTLTEVDTGRTISLVSFSMEQFVGQGRWQLDMLTETLRRAEAMIELRADGADFEEMAREMIAMSNEYKERRAQEQT